MAVKELDNILYFVLYNKFTKQFEVGTYPCTFTKDGVGFFIHVNLGLKTMLKLKGNVQYKLFDEVVNLHPDFDRRWYKLTTSNTLTLLNPSTLFNNTFQTLSTDPLNREELVCEIFLKNSEFTVSNPVFKATPVIPLVDVELTISDSNSNILGYKIVYTFNSVEETRFIKLNNPAGVTNIKLLFGSYLPSKSARVDIIGWTKYSYLPAQSVTWITPKFNNNFTITVSLDLINNSLFIYWLVSQNGGVNYLPRIVSYRVRRGSVIITTGYIDSNERISYESSIDEQQENTQEFVTPDLPLEDGIYTLEITYEEGDETRVITHEYIVNIEQFSANVRGARTYFTLNIPGSSVYINNLVDYTAEDLFTIETDSPTGRFQVNSVLEFTIDYEKLNLSIVTDPVKTDVLLVSYLVYFQLSPTQIYPIIYILASKSRVGSSIVTNYSYVDDTYTYTIPPRNRVVKVPVPASFVGNQIGSLVTKSIITFGPSPELTRSVQANVGYNGNPIIKIRLLDTNDDLLYYYNLSSVAEFSIFNESITHNY